MSVLKHDLQSALNRNTNQIVFVENSNESTADHVVTGKQTASKPAFQIGNLDDLCSKISVSNNGFQSYTNLVVEVDRSLDYEEEAFGNQRYLKNKKEKQIKQHAPEHPISTKPKDIGAPKLIELYQYPGFDGQHSTALPNNVSSRFIFTKVIRAQPTLAGQAVCIAGRARPNKENQSSVKSKYKIFVEKILFSSVSQALLQDVFWWLFLDGWQPNVKTQERLFNRVSRSYIELIISARDQLNHSEPFLMAYPKMLSQGVYASYCEAFIDSITRFDDQFKDKITTLVHRWFTGINATPRSWLNWNLDELEPTEIKARKNLLKKSKNKSNQEHFEAIESKQKNAPSFDDSSSSFDSLTLTSGDTKPRVVFKSLPVKKAQKKTSFQSHAAGKGPETVPFAFNLCGNSPLVKHFLQMSNLERNAGTDIFVTRIEHQNLPSLDAPTYRDIISESFNNVRERQKIYQNFYDRCLKENADFSFRQRQEFQLFRRKEALLLSKPRDVKRLSDIITVGFGRERGASSTAASRAIVEAALKSQE